MKVYYVFSNYLLLTTPYSFKNNSYKSSRWRELYVLLWYALLCSCFVISVHSQLFNVTKHDYVTNKVMIVLLNINNYFLHTILAYKAIFAYKLQIEFFRNFVKFDNYTKFHEKTNWILYCVCIIGTQLFCVVRCVLELQNVPVNKMGFIIVDRIEVLLFCNVDLLIVHFSLSLKQRFSFINEQIRKISKWNEKESTFVGLEQIYEQFLIMSDLVDLFNAIHGWQVLSVIIRTLMALMFLINSVVVHFISGYVFVSTSKLISNLIGALSAIVSLLKFLT